jgi:dihydroxyacid dehydratase/phosphogluconate dehydratase
MAPQVLHLLAIARAAGVALSLDDFQAVSDRTPFLADLKPSGRFVMEDVHKARAALTLPRLTHPVHP